MTLYRTTERWYKPHAFDGTCQQVHLVAQEKPWQGAVGAACASQTRYLYDGTRGFANWATPPIWGLLQEVWRTQVCDSTAASDWLPQAQYEYVDGHGNRTQESDANGRTTTTTYDTNGTPIR